MAPPSARKSRPSHPSATVTGNSNPSSLMRIARKRAAYFVREHFTVAYAKSLLVDPARLGIVSWVILLVELVLNVLVVQRVRYTEIDWRAYMQECEGFLNGTTNYAELRGDTGPLVYPAGFVYVYSALYFITAHGTNIRLAQYIFVGIYLLQMYLVLRLYTKTLKLPPYVLLITTFTSYRVHSIYVLRLFNDPIAIVLLYAALNCYASGRWTWGSVLLSLGVAVKMNVLLFAPAILLLYLTNLGVLRTVRELAVCGGLQVILGAPFLLTYPVEYLRGSFDLGRVFEHKWTVNWRFLPREWFEWNGFHAALLVLHIVLLAAFVRPAYTYMQAYSRLRHVQKGFQQQIDRQNVLRRRPQVGNPGDAVTSKDEAENDDGERETLTDEQQSFLKSFENTLQKSAPGGKKTIDTAKQRQQLQRQQQHDYTLNCEKTVQLILLPLFLANFIGVACARSLHYQFYVWYFHSLPYLVWCTGYSLSVKFLLLGVIEFAWNTYPSTVASSAALHAAHALLLWGLAQTLYRKVPNVSATTTTTTTTPKTD